ncbi:cysteine desulfurase family protein [Cellulomonas alba]|uniref:Aminotransferase class V-fold PLP-dependent enzyme n=1 Tax=Cellulomonas alba TaxID=3053467 RepID=A0ABT7SBQ1_9CELL|nr:aminotransferase class V-fold PLP-dependent enzyme [Cellulomonas alba]MDM7853615.1 aminotransferase class V-fold PLP-dependent enzyme [Cellulomonas alba]
MQSNEPDGTAAAGVSHATGERVFLDAGGRAPVLPQARAAFLEALDQGWGDPRRLHAEGRRARALLDGAREAIAAVVGARTDEVGFAGSHVAALHGAVLSVARGRRRVGADVVVPAVERAAVLAAADFVAARGDGTRRTVPVDATGRADLDAFRDAVARPGVVLAAMQHANGEVGTLQPVGDAHDAARAAGVPLLVDAGASLGHTEVGTDWDLLAADPGDWGAPGGLGVLVARTAVRRTPDWPEDDDRWFPGGAWVPAALAAAVALQLAVATSRADDAALRPLVERVRAAVPASVPDVDVVGDPERRLPHVVTFSCLYVDGEALVTALDRHGFAVGSGSACTSSALEPSHVLAAMGALTHGNIRIGLHRGVSAADVERFLAVLPGVVADVRGTAGVHGL